ncbi:hypothetical protein BYT27DRAFT_7254566 [Phlegmacium glaucopus]|nr:hypothetical protein BYT27DRAFT_7254566 [Phlegmacium glaucopus]
MPDISATTPLMPTSSFKSIKNLLSRNYAGTQSSNTDKASRKWSFKVPVSCLDYQTLLILVYRDLKAKDTSNTPSQQFAQSNSRTNRHISCGEELQNSPRWQDHYHVCLQIADYLNISVFPITSTLCTSPTSKCPRTESSALAQRYRSATARQAFGIPPSESDEFHYKPEHQQQSTAITPTAACLFSVSRFGRKYNYDELSISVESLFRELRSGLVKGVLCKGHQQVYVGFMAFPRLTFEHDFSDVERFVDL